MKKYTVREVEPMESGTRVFDVEYPAPFLGRPTNRSTCEVWVYEDRANCTACQTPLCGMSGSCVHAKAVKRLLKAVRALQVGGA